MKWNLEAYIEWKNKRHWYDVRKVLSYNALYNFIIGLRNSGSGKELFEKPEVRNGIREWVDEIKKEKKEET